MITRTSALSFRDQVRRHHIHLRTGSYSDHEPPDAVAATLTVLPHPHRVDRQRHPIPPAPRYAGGPTAAYVTHMFDMRCRENGIEHRFTKINHTWTTDQVERLNRTIKEATVQRYQYDRHDQLRRHLGDFVDTYNRTGTVHPHEAE